ncbi:hypothetical protein [Pseudomonas fluorescens]|uniref:Uncharacterized protein n=1 Tax=Pseudomonas fluorescens TaxID=294 RepID=A0A5E7DFA6_PSEFL|nr:hypothetical protein [Pseudomonas fluorescens]VVO14881.1 hypothetical protein PS691_03708 [Pseudomonas fluorescens]
MRDVRLETRGNCLHIQHNQVFSDDIGRFRSFSFLFGVALQE